MKHPLVIFGAALALGLPAAAAEFQMQLYETPAELAKRGDAGPAGKAYWDAYAAYGQALQAAGVLRGGAALRVDGEASTVRLQGGQPRIGKDVTTLGAARLGGYFVIEAADIDAAQAWAARSPTAITGGVVELRPFFPVPGMMR